MKSKILKLNILIVLFISALFLSSCLEDEDAKNRAEEKRIIEDYVGIHYPGAVPTSSGLYFITDTLRNEDGKSPVLENNDYMIFSYTGKYLESSKVFDTSDSITAVNEKISGLTYMEYNGPLKTSFFNSQSVFNFYSMGVIEGLVKMKEGGKYTLIMPSLLVFNNYKPAIYNVELLKVIDNSKIKQFELEQIERTISTWPKTDTTFLTLADSTRPGTPASDTIVSGLYQRIDTVGTGAYPVNNQVVTVNYTLKLISYKDEKYLDISERLIEKKDNYKITLSRKQAIAGFYGAVKNMKKGETSTWIIPYWRGYGAERMYNTTSYRVALPECATLIYQIKLVP